MIAEFRVTPKNIQEIGRALGSLSQIPFSMLFSEHDARAKLVILCSLMKISSGRHLQFFQADFETELLQAVDAAFCYSLTVAFIKVVSA